VSLLAHPGTPPSPRSPSGSVSGGTQKVDADENRGQIGHVRSVQQSRGYSSRAAGEDHRSRAPWRTARFAPSAPQRKPNRRRRALRSPRRPGGGWWRRVCRRAGRR
jgi:hypothetical protein